MKKLLCLFLLVACGLLLVSCIGDDTCSTHIDNNGDLKCDLCSTDVECTSHKDTNGDLKCDKCAKPVTCTHKDLDKDGNCDINACNYVFCEHEYADEYSYNKTHHYFLPTCGCNTPPKDNALHTDTNKDGVCDVCEWNFNHTHTYESTYTYDKTHHWFAPTCGHDVKKASAHEDKAKDGICDVCGWDYDHEHEYEKEWSIDEDKHWHAVSCDHLIDVKDEGNHIDINNDGICDVCAWNYNHTHKYAGEISWTYDDTHHWHAAICGHDIPGINAESHVDLDENGECDVCGCIVCEGDHTINENEWFYNEEKHWQNSNCGHDTFNCTMEAQGHQWSNDDGITCTMCGYKSSAHTHEFDDSIWEADITGHWHRYTCHSKYTTDLEPHVDVEGNDGVCDICEFQFCQHEFNENEWVASGTTHWHTTVCDHIVDTNKKDEAEHVDVEGNDGICDVCEYVMCTHPESDEYLSDLTSHWKKLNCRHEIPEDRKKAHEDINEDGICDTCDKQFCEHEYDTDNWSSDRDYHWHAPICGHKVEPIDKAPHQDLHDNGICKYCEVYCNHSYESEWTSNSTHHWYAADCGHSGAPIEKLDHIDENEDGECDACGYIVCEGEHKVNRTELVYNEYGHWNPSICGHETQKCTSTLSAHVYDEEGIHCMTCGYDNGHRHTYDPESWEKDGIYHWHRYTCHSAFTTKPELHDDQDNDGTCIKCGVYCTHENFIEGEFGFDGTHHWPKVECGHKLPANYLESHSEYDVDNSGYCTKCEQQYCEHEWSEEWYTDGEYHWKYATCGHDVQFEKAAHTDNDHNNKCDFCERKCFFEDDIHLDTSDPIITPPLIITPKQEGEE